MKTNSILSFFTPKDAKFFPMLNEAADIVVKSGAYLELFFSSPGSKTKDICQQIKDEELKGDKVAARISKALNSTFITPFDREDIHLLSDAMDDVIDVINRSAQKVLLYQPEKLPKYMLRMATIVKKGTVEVKSAVAELPNLKKNDRNIRKYCKEIKKLEESADSIYEEGIITLFNEKITTIELIKLKEILSELEAAVDKINNTGKIIKTMVVKYA